MKTKNLVSSFKLNNDLIIQKVGQKMTLFNATTSTMYTLNKTAEMILTGVQNNWDKDLIINKIKKTFETDSIEISQDVEDCLTDLVKKKIIIKKTTSKG